MASLARGERLIPSIRRILRLRHYSRRAEDVYVSWVRRYVRFHGMKHPAALGEAELEGYLADLAERRRVSSGTQNQALAALLFMYRPVRGIPMSPSTQVHAKRPKRVPVVLSPEEVWAVLSAMSGVTRLAAFLYIHVMNRGGLGVRSPADMRFCRRHSLRRSARSLAAGSRCGRS